MPYVPPEQFVPTLPHGVAYAAALFTDAEGRVLLLHSVSNPRDHQFPGGLLDAGEHLWECALRETREEIGFVPQGLDTPRLLMVAFTPPRDPWPYKVGALFDGGVLTAEEIGRIRLDPEEHTAFALRTVEEWRSIVTPRRRTTLDAAVAARAAGTAAYLHLTDPE